MKISASLYSNKTKKIETLTEELDSVNIDMLHVDFNDNKINADKTINLSATGSKNAPNLDVCFRYLARNPSSQSVRAAAMNMPIATQ